jgi:hypothetical protein
MAEAPELSEPDSESPVLIAYVAEDAFWAERLQSDLARAGVEVVRIESPFEVTDADIYPPGVGPHARGLVSLVTPVSVHSKGFALLVDAFEGMMESLRRPSIVVPIFFGEELLAAASSIMTARRSILVDRSIYETRDFEAAQWSQAVALVEEALATPLPPASTPVRAKDVFSRARFVETRHGREGWLLGDDLAILRTDGDIAEQQLEISCQAGNTQALVAAWPSKLREELGGFSLLRLNPVLDLSPPLPIGAPTHGSLVQIWGAEKVTAAIVGETLPSGSVGLSLQEDMPQENGAPAWNLLKEAYVGIAVHLGGGRWRLLPVELLRELAGKPAISAAIMPPSACIHDDSWTIEDQLGYGLYGRAIKEFVEHPDTRPPLVIGVQGPWGQGKTSLMRIAQSHLDGGHPDLQARQDQNPFATDGPSEMTFKKLRDSLDGDIKIEASAAKEVRSVWFNPWKYQNSEALWAGLAHAILTQLPARLPRAEQELFWLRLQLQRIDAAAVRHDIHRQIFERFIPGLIIALAVAVLAGVAVATVGADAAVGALSGLSVGAALAAASWVLSRKKELDRKLEGSYLRYVRQPDYEGKLGYLHHVEEDVRGALHLLTPEGQPTMIFIDDLDRCSAGKISEVLEAINLFLSGEYPNCIFVLGIDAQVVASAMETVHRQAFGEDEGEKDDLRGNLGWRFLDKFIQLSLVMPRLSERQQAAYLSSLIGSHDETRAAIHEGDRDVLADAESIRRELASGELKAEEAAKRVGQLADSRSPLDAEVRKIAEDVITLGARDFSDSDPEAVDALRRRLPHLSDNPRTIKRAVNLYRFYRFIAWARHASSSDLNAADPELIASWTVLAARWPQVVHWLQAEGRRNDDPSALLRENWGEDEPALSAFLRHEEQLDLNRAMECGLW